MANREGKEVLNDLVENKSAFWRFERGVVKDEKEYDEFIGEISEHHELVELFSCSGEKNLFRYNPYRTISSLLYCDILKILSLKGNRMNDSMSRHLASFLKQTPTCGYVDISGNSFTRRGVNTICEALHRNNVVLDFKFTSNGVTDAMMGAFRTVLEENNVMEALDLSNNSFTATGEDQLVEGMKSNDGLRKLDYSHITTKKQSIQEKLRRNMLNWREKFIRELDREETGKWNRSKLMFIGQGRAGKTSTVNRLLNKGFDAAQDSTVGASVSQTQTSTTQEQQWKQIQESDPEFLGKGMASQQAGRLLAARNLVNREDKGRREALKKRKERDLKTEKEKKQERQRKRMAAKQNGNVPVELSPEAKRLMADQAKRDQEAQDLLVAQELQRKELGLFDNNNTNNRAADRRLAEQLAREEEMRMEREKEDDTAKLYADAVFKAAREGKDSITFSLWDYGGQSVFYALHHLFLTKYGVYVLCVKMTEILEHPTVAKEYLYFWLNSVKLHAPTAPVLLVGTHLDSLKKPQEELVEVNEFVQDNFAERFPQLVSMHPKFAFYPVDNFNNKGVNELRFDIERISRKQDFVTADVSVRWMFCLDKIMVKRDTGGEAPAWMKLSDVRGIAESAKMEGHEELEKMLVLFHELGVLVRLTGTEELRNLITLDPQWLLDGLCKVIRDERLHGPSAEELEKVGLTQEMDLLYKKGLASVDVMKYLWSDDKFREHYNYLLDLMKYMVLISDWDFRSEKMFIIPSLLIPRPEDIDLFDHPDKKHLQITHVPKKKKGKKKTAKQLAKERAEKEKADKLKTDEEKAEEIELRKEVHVTNHAVFDFSKVFLPMGVFQRLVCMCVSYSTSLGGRGKSGKKVNEPELYARWAKIWMGNDTVLFLEQRNDEIWLSVEDPSTAPTCYKAVNSMLGKLNADLMGSGLKWAISMITEKKTIVQEEGEKPKKTVIRELEMDEAKARKQNLEPWFPKKVKEEKTTKPKKKLPELVDLENFVDSF